MRFGVAIFLSILFHAALAAALAVYVEYAPAPDALAQLDLSSVELSFAETEDETAAVQPTLASAPEEPVPEEPPPPEPERPPESEPPKELPPELDALKLPEPQPERQPVETPVVEPPKEEPRKEPPRPPVAASAPAPAVAPRQARVDAKDVLPADFKPKYPEGARKRNEQGLVLLEIAINERGRAEGVKILSSSGFHELDEAAVKAVRVTKFKPARADGKAVRATVRLPVNFVLR